MFLIYLTFCETVSYNYVIYFCKFEALSGFSSLLSPQSLSPSQRYRRDKHILLFGHLIFPGEQVLSAANKVVEMMKVLQIYKSK
jgi:hypothetical protein